MDMVTLTGYLNFLNAAAPLGVAAVAAVKGFMAKELTADEQQQVLALWSDNRARAAANAGIEE